MSKNDVGILIFLMVTIYSTIIAQYTSSLPCTNNYQYAIIRTNILFPSQYICISGFIQSNDGSAILQAIPIYDNSYTLNDSQIIAKFSNFISFQQQTKKLVDFQAIFGYKQNHTINIAINATLKQLILIYQRLPKSIIKQHFSSNCLPFQVSTLITASSQLPSPQCKYPGSVVNRIINNRCQCHPNYYFHDCSAIIYPVHSIKYANISPYQIYNYYYIPSSYVTAIVIMNSTKYLNIIASIQPLSTYPYISIANYYNHLQKPFLPHKLSTDDCLLVKVTNLSPYHITYAISIITEDIIDNSRIIIIVICTLVVSTFTGVMFWVYMTYYAHYSPRIINRFQFKNADIFPSVKYQHFKSIIMNERQFDYDQIKICSICLEDIVNQSFIKYTYCNHILHAQCLQQWMGRQKSCPNCRQIFKDQQIKLWSNKLRSFSAFNRYPIKVNETLQQFKEQFCNERQQSPKNCKKLQIQKNCYQQRNSNSMPLDTYQFYKSIWYFHHHRELGKQQETKQNLLIQTYRRYNQFEERHSQ